MTNVTSESGVVRSTTVGKIDFLLVRDGPMLWRWAKLLSDAVPDKGERNWTKGRDHNDLIRFRAGAARHFEQWLAGECDGDHAAAIFFNVNGAEHVEARWRGDAR